MPTTMRRFFTGLIAVTIVCAGFLCGFSGDVLQSAARSPQGIQSAAVGLSVLPAKLALALRPSSAFAADADALPPVTTYFEVMNQIRGDYYSAAPSATKLTYAAIRGMLKTLNDPYTTFWTPAEYREQMEETRGDFDGIGAVLDMTKDKRVIIIEPIENSPAAKKGILPGDVIVRVDGKSVLGMDVNAVVSRIRGRAGTPVALSLLRKGQTRLLELSITRAVIHSPIVEWRMQDEQAKIGYINLKGFNEQSDIQFAEALRKLESRGMKALIFDLRGNPGGLLNVAQDVASRFIAKGPLVWVAERNGSRTSLDVEPEKHQSRLDTGAYPLVVLVNGYSASASEIVAGAIKDYGVGTLVGTTTFGKGMVQTIIPLPDQSAVKITTQHYFTPKLNDINKKVDETGKQISGGIKPDVVIEISQKDIDALAEAVRANPEAARSLRSNTQYDPQLRKAVAILGEKLLVENTRLTER